ncbi:MAG: hypothetical protein HC801_08180, partial [Nitrospira sp.]|nr:hypothetical protein [Nitrospira sp.]
MSLSQNFSKFSTPREVMVAPALRYPSNWKRGGRGWSSTSGTRGCRGFRLYSPTTLAELVDSPVIMGEHLRTNAMETLHGVEHAMHAVAPRAEQALLPDVRRLRAEPDRHVLPDELPE